MNIEAVQNVKDLLAAISVELQKNLQQNLVGIYLYGSLAVGGYNPASSDVDILVVTKEKLVLDSKLKIIDALIKFSETAPAGGFELTIITTNVLNDFIYPTPVELYFTSDLKEKFLNGQVDLSKPAFEEGLAINIAVVKQKGMCIFGKPVAQVIPEVTREYSLKAAVYDLNWSYNNVMKGSDSGECWVPPYAVLNACRILAYSQAGLLISKVEGGEWALENLPKKYQSVIRSAIKEHVKSDKANTVDARLLKEFMNFVKSTVEREVRI